MNNEFLIPKMKKYIITPEGGVNMQPTSYVAPGYRDTIKEAEAAALEMATKIHHDVLIYERVARVISKPEIIKEDANTTI